MSAGRRDFAGRPAHSAPGPLSPRVVRLTRAAPGRPVRGREPPLTDRRRSSRMLSNLLYVRSFLITRLRMGDRGATAVEYGLIVALIAAVIVGIVGILGG